MHLRVKDNSGSTYLLNLATINDNNIITWSCVALYVSSDLNKAPLFSIDWQCERLITSVEIAKETEDGGEQVWAIVEEYKPRSRGELIEGLEEKSGELIVSNKKSD